MKLLEFPHSHYCEKARWALDYKKIPFQAVPILPGFHLITVRRYAPGTSVPVLIDNGKAVQGSGAIIDFLEERYPEYPLTPAEKEQRKICLEIENNHAEVLGVTVRQILYSRLLDYPEYIRHCFTQPMPYVKQLVFRLSYPILRQKIYQTYVISDKMVERARRKLDTALSKLESRLGNKTYFVGDHFSRADISVASMLSFLAMPPEHPFPWEQIPDPHIKSIYDQYQKHPMIRWVGEMYAKHRLYS